MRLKQSAADFRVFEELEFERDPEGMYAIHTLTKEKLDTLEALDRVARAAEVPRASIAYAGLKDRQAITQQHISLEKKRVRIDDRDLKVRFLGRSAEKITSKQSTGNRFQIVVRDLGPADIACLRRNRRSVETAGLPNYYDDQRFGCLYHGQGFVVASLAAGRPDRALRQLIATPPTMERSGDAKLRRILSDHWGDWETCHQIARGPMYDAIFLHLRRRPDDFVGAIEHVPTRLKVIHLFSFQSWLWNLGVRRCIEGLVPRRQQVRIPSLCGPLTCWRYLPAEVHEGLDERELPLMDAATRFEDRRFREAMAEVLERAGLTQESLAIERPSGFRLREEPRRLVLHPGGLTVLGPWPDNRNRGRLKVELRFRLPRGAYATLVVRRLFAEQERERDWDDRRKPGPRSSKPGRSGGQGPRRGPEGRNPRGRDRPKGAGGRGPGKSPGGRPRRRSPPRGQ